MRPDFIEEQAEEEHDRICWEGYACHTRSTHIANAYIPRILREHLNEAYDEITQLRNELDNLRK